VELLDDHYCFACGNLNPIGMHLVFERSPERVSAEFTPRRDYQGYAGLVHGGIICTLLDEAMAYMASTLDCFAVTARLEVRFRKPAAVDEPVCVSASIEEDRGKTIILQAEIKNQKGQIIAEGRSVFVRGKKHNPQPKGPV